VEIERPAIANFTDATHAHEANASGGKLAFWREIPAGDDSNPYSDGATIYQVPCGLAHSFPSGLTGAEFYCTVAPADGDVVLTMKQAGATVGTITFSQGQYPDDAGVVSSSGWSAVAGAGKFEIIGPDPADSAFAGFHGVMVGTRY
jgi:hypothetical protein